MDVTNELKANQKEARAAKDLRGQVTELQAEILKAGELIIRYRRRLSDYMCTPPENTQHEMFRAAYIEEVKSE